MAHMRQPGELPQFINKEGYNQIIENELNNYENLNNWVWPITSWTIIFVNTLIAFIAFRDMYILTYNPINHILMTTIFVATLGGLAFIYKFIIRGR